MCRGNVIKKEYWGKLVFSGLNSF